MRQSSNGTTNIHYEAKTACEEKRVRRTFLLAVCLSPRLSGHLPTCCSLPYLVYAARRRMVTVHHSTRHLMTANTQRRKTARDTKRPSAGISP
jgi:hypothetical protein